MLDLRDNGGGLLNEAVLSASVFLSKGELVVSTDSRTMGEREYEAIGEPLPRHPTVVLINRDTASAAEILASALGDHDLATIVGTRSFGKGTFQELIQLAAGGALDLTVGEYFTAGRDLAGRQGDQARGQGRGRSGDAPRRGPAPGAGGACREDAVGSLSSPPGARGARQAGGDLRAARPLHDRRAAVRARAAGDPRSRLDPRSSPARSRWSTSARVAPAPCGRSAQPRARATWSPRCFGIAAWTVASRRRSSPRPAMQPWRRARRRSPAATSLISPRSPSTRRRRATSTTPSRPRPEGDGVRLWVHIADVAAHVRPGGGLDSEALRRGTSTYVPGHGGADASRGAERRGVQPCARGGPAGGDRRDRAGLGRRASGGELLPEPHPLRRAPRLRPAG